MKKRASLISLTLCLCLSLFACTGNQAPNPSDTEPAITPAGPDRVLYGMMEILTWTEANGYDVEKAIDNTVATGAKGFRLVINARDVMASPGVFAGPYHDAYHGWIERLLEGGVTQIVGMSGTWFLPEGVIGPNSDVMVVPDIDHTADSDYMRFLAMFEETWFALAKNYPQIKLWEMGNETNHTPFLHPVDYDGTNPFTRREHAIITADMMFYANRGIKAANPDARTIMPALAPVNGVADMAEDLRLIYAAIASGECGEGETDADLYFDALAWHPYTSGMPDDAWVSANQQIYQVAIDNGDDGKRVFFTEFGFSDDANASGSQRFAEYYREAYRLVERRMPYVETMHVYCLLDYPPFEIYYGIFSIGDDKRYLPQPEAYAIQEIFGGTGDFVE